MTELTYTTMRNLYAALKSLGQDNLKVRANVRISMALNLQEIEPFVLAFDRAAKDELIRVVGVDDKTGRPNEVTPVLAAVHDQVMREASDKSEQVNIRTVAIDDLKLDDNKSVSPEQIAYLAPMIEFGGE